MRYLSRYLVIVISFVSLSDLQAQAAFGIQLSEAAVELTKDHVVYDPSYFSIPYPNGDIPADKGVCTDVIIRAYRKLGVDLQKEVHEDMKQNFHLYPRIWGLTKPDPNIDHRRVPNLMTFFTRKGKKIATSHEAKDYLPGDIVTWNLGGGTTHIGILINQKSIVSERPLIVHNIGNGQEVSDCLFAFKISGHFRYST